MEEDTNNAAAQALPAMSTTMFQAVQAELQAWAEPLSQFAIYEEDFQQELEVFHQQVFPSQRILGGESGRLPTLRRLPLPTIDEDAARAIDPVMERTKNQLRPLAESDQLQQQAQDAREHTRKDGRLTIPAELRREVFRLHRNLGHPDLQTFLRALRHAQAKPEVVEWTKKEFRCPICEASRKPSIPRPGHLVRSLEFNQTVGTDVVYFEWKGVTYPLMNNMCWGTGLQIMTRMEQVNAENTYQTFLANWVIPFGVPNILIMDQGREFFGEEFSQRIMEMGTMVHFTDTNSPWQNGRTEKAGGIFKEKLAMVLDETSAMTLEDLDICIKEVQIARNRYFSKSGFSPYQRAFGVNPRLPGSLMSDDFLNPELLQVSASADMRKSWAIREAAAIAWMKQQDIEAVRRSVKAKTRSSDLKELAVGEWVFIWRSIPGFTGWSGPGVLLAISPSEKSMWVSLRGHLMKVSREHLRSATSEEHLCAELIKELSAEMLKDIQSGRIRQYHDLTNEPTPDQERQLAITTEAIPEHEVRDFVEPDEPYTPTSPLNDLDGDYDVEVPPLEPVVNQPDATDVPMPEVPAEDVSTRIPSQAATTSNAPSLRSDVPAPRTGAGIMVDEGSGGVLGALRSRQTTPRVSPYPHPFSNPPSLPSMPSTPSNADFVNSYFEVVEFEEFRPRHNNWTNGSDGAMWWTDQRTGAVGLTPLSQESFTATDAECSFSSSDKCMFLTKVKTSPGQIEFRKLNDKHREIFVKARTKEVQSLLDNKAIRILSLEESNKFRKEFPDHILPSRYVDRWKPTGDKFSVLPEGFDEAGFEPMNDSGLAAKSRWCVVGWKDPLIHAIERSAPTPLSTSIYLFFQLSASRQWRGKVKDAKTAFLQSLPTTRKNKLACTMPPDWNFPGCVDGQLVLLDTEVYGLVSGPAWWRKTFLRVLTRELGYRISPFDRCVLTLDSPSHAADAETQGVIVVEVDDILEAGNAEHQKRMAWLETKLRFGKTVDLMEEKHGTGYAGRRVRQLADFGYEYSMDDYTQNRLRPVTLERKVLLKNAKETALNESEEAQLRGSIASLNWAAREGRPDAAAAASILAGSFPGPKVHHALETNKVVQKIKGTSVKLRIHPIPEKDVRHVVIADASFDPTGKTKPQHGWLQGITSPKLNQGLPAPISLIGWKSRRLRRKAGSTMLCESISLSTALGALEKQIATWDSIRISRYDVRQRRLEEDDSGMHGEPTVLASDDPLHQDPLSLAIVDAKSLFDGAASEQASGEDDRSALEIAIIQDSLARCKGRLRWIPHNLNPADMLTKLSQAHELPMMKMLKTSMFQIAAEEDILREGRQHEQRKKVKYDPKDIMGADVIGEQLSHI